MRVILMCALGAIVGACGVPLVPDASADRSASDAAEEAAVVADVASQPDVIVGSDARPDVSIDSGSSADVVDLPRDAGAEASADAGRPNCVDGDGDGYGVGAGCLGADCNDRDPDVHPGAPERCNGADDNCDGMPETVASAPALDQWCRDNAPETTEPANWRTFTQCDGPGRVRINPPDPLNMTSFACRACYRLTTPPFEVACWCWRSPTDRRPCSDFR